VVAEFTFVSVARTSLHNVATDPRWAVANWADTWLDA
jgi:peptide/nickel transport system substrate-binding protein